MSRNRQRTKIQQQSNTQAPPTPQPIMPPQKPENPFGISFVVPKEIVRLPSGGMFYSSDSPVNGLQEVEVKAVTAAEEDILINESYIDKGIVFEKLIDSILMTPGITADDLIDCDKMAILVSARKTGYGDTIVVPSICESCGHQHEAEISLQSILDSNSASTNIPESVEGEWEYLKNSNTFLFTLPTTGLDVHIKILSKNEIESLEQSRKQKIRLNLPFNETLEFLRACIVSVNDVVDMTSINKLVEVLPAADARKIRKVHNMNVPKMNMTEEVACPSCNSLQKEDVPFSLGWFWS